jgi:hypothetical protein
VAEGHQTPQNVSPSLEIAILNGASLYMPDREDYLTGVFLDLVAAPKTLPLQYPHLRTVS